MKVTIIGGGPGGYAAAIKAGQLGYEVILIESNNLGGVCLNWGCIPSKSLLKSAELFMSLSHAKDFGILLNNCGIDVSEVFQRSRNIVNKLNAGINLLMKKNNVKVINGFGTLHGKLCESCLTMLHNKSSILEQKSHRINSFFEVETSQDLKNVNLPNDSNNTTLMSNNISNEVQTYSETDLNWKNFQDKNEIQIQNQNISLIDKLTGDEKLIKQQSKIDEHFTPVKSAEHNFDYESKNLYVDQENLTKNQEYINNLFSNDNKNLSQQNLGKDEHFDINHEYQSFYHSQNCHRDHDIDYKNLNEIKFDQIDNINSKYFNNFSTEFSYKIPSQTVNFEPCLNDNLFKSEKFSAKSPTLDNEIENIVNINHCRNTSGDKSIKWSHLLRSNDTDSSIVSAKMMNISQTSSSDKQNICIKNENVEKVEHDTNVQNLRLDKINNFNDILEKNVQNRHTSANLEEKVNMQIQQLSEERNCNINASFSNVSSHNSKNSCRLCKSNLNIKNVVKVEEDFYSSDYVIVATGSHARELNPKHFDHFDESMIWLPKDALSNKSHIEDLVIIGGGAIGLEFASFFNAIGTKVTVIEMQDSILPSADKEISKLSKKYFESHGIKILTGMSVKSIHNGHVIISNGEKIQASKVLVSIGVIPNTSNIGIENTNIILNNKFIHVKNNYETDDDNIFAIGDVIGIPCLAHKATHDAIHCVNQIHELVTLGNKNSSIFLLEQLVHINRCRFSKRYDRAKTFDSLWQKVNFDKCKNTTKDVDSTSNTSNNLIPMCVYTFPQIAYVGMTEEEAGPDVKIGKFNLSANGKSMCIGENDGMVKVIIDKESECIVGAHMIGAEVTEMITTFTIAIQFRIKASDFLKVIFPHPTISESIFEATFSANYGRGMHS